MFIVLRHDRRRVVHFNVTDHPYAEWAAQQIIDAFPYEEGHVFCCATATALMASTFNSVSTVSSVGRIRTLLLLGGYRYMRKAATFWGEVQLLASQTIR